MSNSLLVTLDAEALGALVQKARGIGVSPEALAGMLVEQALYDQAYAESRAGMEELVVRYEDEGPARPWDEVRPELEALIERTFGPD